MNVRQVQIVWTICLLPLMHGCTSTTDRIPSAPTTKSPPTAPAPGGTDPTAIPTVTIAVGEVIHDRIGPDDPVCDPAGWDAHSPCKRFLVVPPMNGTLKVTLTADIPGSRSDALDFIVLSPIGALIYAGINERVNLPVEGGTTYEVRINSYPYLLPPPGALEFDLRTEM